MALLLLTSSPAISQVAWTDPSGGDWTDGANWSTGTAPGPLDTVHFALGAPDLYDVFLDAPVLVTGIDLGQDRTRLVLGPAASLLAGGPFSLRIGVGLATDQSSWLHVHGGEAQTKNVFIGMVPHTDAELDLAGGVEWFAEGVVIMGSNGGGATLLVRDGAALETTDSLLTFGGFSDERPIRCRFVGAGTLGVIGGSFTTGVAVNIIHVHEGAQLEVAGDAHFLTTDQGEVGGLEVKDRGSVFEIGGSLTIGTGFWGVARVCDDGHLVVGGDLRAGAASVRLPSRLDIDGGTVDVLGDLRPGSNPTFPSSLVNLISGTMTVAGTIHLSEHNPFYSIVVPGPSTTTGPVGIFTSHLSSWMAMHPGGVVEAPQYSVGPGALVQCLGGSIVSNVALDGRLTVPIDVNADSPRLSISGPLVMNRSARVRVVLWETPPVELARGVVVDGAAVVSGDLVVEGNFLWWSGPRRPVEILRANTLEGAFDSITLDQPPWGPPLELRQTANTIRVQTDFVEDLNDDGFVDSADLGILLTAWGPGPSPADFNDDGVVNGADLALLLTVWNGQ